MAFEEFKKEGYSWCAVHEDWFDDPDWKRDWFKVCDDCLARDDNPYYPCGCCGRVIKIESEDDLDICSICANYVDIDEYLENQE